MLTYDRIIILGLDGEVVVQDPKECWTMDELGRLFAPLIARRVDAQGRAVGPGGVPIDPVTGQPSWRSPGAAVASAPAKGGRGHKRNYNAAPGVVRGVFYANDAIKILGLDRLKRPDNALAALLDRGALPRKKLRGRLIFRQEDLDAVMNHGARTGRRGRPPGSKTRKPAPVAA